MRPVDFKAHSFTALSAVNDVQYGGGQISNA